jgi:methylsterol monooxygenase
MLQTHILTMWMFLAWQLNETVIVHSGYDFFGGAGHRYNRHHERFNVHFGAMLSLNQLHGTDESKTLAKKDN